MNRKLIAAAAAALALAVTAQARASVAIYTDAASFNAATSGDTTSGFSFSNITTLGSGYTIGPVTFQSSDIGGYNDGSYGSNVSYLGSSEPRLAITGGYNAFSLMLGAYDGASTFGISVNGAAPVDLDINGQPNSTFVGFTDNVPITSISISDLTSPGAEIDTLSFTTGFTAAVPEPSTWAMMILGFAGVGFMAYRRKSKPVWMAA
jgi:hypothetical protein